MKIENIIPSELKVVASSHLDISQDLNVEDPQKTLGEILNEKEDKNTKSQD